MSKPPAEGRDAVQTVRKSYRVLDALKTQGNAGVTELASELGMSKSAVHRHLSTLIAEGQVEKSDGKYRLAPPDTDCVELTFEIIEALKRQTKATPRAVAEELDEPEATVAHLMSWLEQEHYLTKNGDVYSNGLKFLDIGERVRYEMGVFDIAVEEVDKLAEESGEMALLSVLEHGQNVHLYKARGEDAIQSAHETGLREPLHFSALGKAILSTLPREQVEAIIDQRGLPAFTENTITDRDELFEDLKRTRERGYSIDNEEAKQGIKCIAAPVVLEERGIHAAISVTGPKSRMRGDRFEQELPELVTSAANVIEVNAIYV